MDDYYAEHYEWLEEEDKQINGRDQNLTGLEALVKEKADAARKRFEGYQEEAKASLLNMLRQKSIRRQEIE